MTIFSKIIAGEIPSYKCAENEEFYAFLDISPVAQGHTLVVPKREEDYLFDLTDEELARMTVFAKRVAPSRRHFPAGRWEWPFSALKWHTPTYTSFPYNRKATWTSTRKN